MKWDICKKTGVIQLQSPLEYDLVYQSQHADGVGTVWQNHYKDFVTFLSQFNLSEILEIGGASGIVAQQYLNLNQGSTWTMIEPNPTVPKTTSIKVIKKWFDESIRLDKQYGAVVHSHVLEHVYNPVLFLKTVNASLSKGGYHCFSIPNMMDQLNNCYTNCLNFEHTYFLSEDIADYLLERCGFEIVEKTYYLKHSIFYATRKVKEEETADLALPNNYSSYKKLFSNFISYHRDLINDLNEKTDHYDGSVYLFGAHIFSLYLISFGLKTSKIAGILDNSTTKQGKRLYGTEFTIESPKY